MDKSTANWVFMPGSRIGLKLTKTQFVEFFELVDQGVRVSVIADKFNLNSVQTAYNYIRDRELIEPQLQTVEPAGATAFVKRAKFDDALDAECRSWPRAAGVYRRSFYTSAPGLAVSVIKDQQVVVAESDGRYFIALQPEPGTESIRLLPIESVGGFFELIRKDLSTGVPA
jgi:hypothetical protein